MNAINALASTVNPQYDPMYQHMARVHAPPGAAMFAIQPASSARPAPTTPARRPRGGSRPVEEEHDDGDESGADPMAAPSGGPVSIEWNMDSKLSAGQIGQDAYVPGKEDSDPQVVQEKAEAFAGYMSDKIIGPASIRQQWHDRLDETTELEDKWKNTAVYWMINDIRQKQNGDGDFKWAIEQLERQNMAEFTRSSDL